MSWKPLFLSDGVNLLWSPGNNADRSPDTQDKREKTSFSVWGIREITDFDILTTFVVAHNPVQKPNLSRSIQLPLEKPTPQSRRTKVVAHDPSQKTTVPGRYGARLTAFTLPPPRTYKVKAHDPEQKFFKDTRFVPLKTLGKLEYDAYLVETPRRWSLVTGAFAGDETSTTTDRFTLLEGIRRYNLVEQAIK